MKKLLALILAITMVFAFAACGGDEAEKTENKVEETVSETENKTVTETVETDTVEEEKIEEEKIEEEKIEAETVAVGNTITLDFAEMTVSEAVIADDIQTSVKNGHITYTTGPQSKSDTEFVYIRGTIKNTSKSSFSMLDVVGSVEIDGYSYPIDNISAITSEGQSTYSLDPLMSVTYTIYAEVPNELAASASPCVVNFGFDENFASVPHSSTGTPDLPYNYTLTISK